MARASRAPSRTSRHPHATETSTRVDALVPPSERPERSERSGSQVRAGTVVRATALVASCVVATTTALSAYLGDDPPDVSPVPMISDTFVHASASYVARAGIVAVACLLLVTTLTVRSFLRALRAKTGPGKTRRWAARDGRPLVRRRRRRVCVLVVAAVNDRVTPRRTSRRRACFSSGRGSGISACSCSCGAPEVTTSSLKWKLGCARRGVSLAFSLPCAASAWRFYEPTSRRVARGGEHRGVHLEPLGGAGRRLRGRENARARSGSSQEEASPSTGRGMSLGSVGGTRVDQDQLLDALVAASRSPRRRMQESTVAHVYHPGCSFTASRFRLDHASISSSTPSLELPPPVPRSSPISGSESSPRRARRRRAPESPAPPARAFRDGLPKAAIVVTSCLSGRHPLLIESFRFRFRLFFAPTPA